MGSGRVDEQGLLAFSEVAEYGFAGLVLIAEEPEDIVPELIDDADAAADGAQPLDQAVVASGEDRGDGQRGFE